MAAIIGALPATVLVVEDHWLVAEATTHAVRELGFKALGPAVSVAQAFAALDAERPSAVILDTVLGRESSLPVAERLLDQGTPFAFFTGYTADHLPERFRACPVLTKPVFVAELEACLKRLLST